MEKYIIDIKDGLYDTDLLYHLNGLRAYDTVNKQLIEALIALCKIDLVSVRDSETIFSAKEKDALLNNDYASACPNIEIIARWCDFLQTNNTRQRRQFIKQACSGYLTIYKSTKNIEYLIRKMHLMRKAPGLFSDELEDIFNYCKDVIFHCDAPFRQNQLLKELFPIYKERCKSEFTDFLEAQIRRYCENSDFLNSRFSLNSLKDLGCIKSNEWHIRLAENFESEGDHHVANKKPNFCYPNISQTYLKGLREVKDISGCSDLKHKLEGKLIKEQTEFSKLIQTFGIRMNPPIDLNKIRKIVVDANIHDFDSAFAYMLGFPIISKEIVFEEFEKLKKRNDGFNQDFFSGTAKINNKGRKTGSATLEDSLLNQIRDFQRNVSISYLTEVKNVMDIDRIVSKEFIYGGIEYSKSKFIPEERLNLYVEGLFAGFNNDFILSAHLLIPQMENSFKYIAEQNDINIAKLTEEIQHDNMLGGCLEKIKDKTDIDLYTELYEFLVNKNSINFRNELCHGLMNPLLIHYYGIYLWWLCLKIIFKTEDYFSFPK